MQKDGTPGTEGIETKPLDWQHDGRARESEMSQRGNTGRETNHTDRWRTGVSEQGWGKRGKAIVTGGLYWWMGEGEGSCQAPRGGGRRRLGLT